MNIPKLRKEKVVKTYHGYKLVDNYAHVDQHDILDVLKKPEKILPDVKKYIKQNNALTEEYYNNSDFNNMLNEKFSRLIME